MKVKILVLFFVMASTGIALSQVSPDHSPVPDTSITLNPTQNDQSKLHLRSATLNSAKIDQYDNVKTEFCLKMDRTADAIDNNYYDGPLLFGLYDPSSDCLNLEFVCPLDSLEECLSSNMLRAQEFFESIPVIYEAQNFSTSDASITVNIGGPQL